MFLLNLITRSQKKNNKNWTIYPLNYLIYNFVISLKTLPKYFRKNNRRVVC